MRISNLTIAALIAFLAGCATISGPRFNVVVDSLSSPAAEDKRTYVVLPGNEGTTWSDLQFQEYAIYLMRVLNANGFRPVEVADEADIAVVLFYGIGDPETRQYTYSLPVWGQTGVASSQTYGTAIASGNATTYSGTTTYTPTYGVTSYRTGTRTYTTYFRYALVEAYDLKVFRESEEQVQLWKTTITSIGTSSDLRQVFPIMMAAGAPYIASNTDRQLEVQVHESDDVVQAIKGQITQSPEAQAKP